MTPEPNPPPAPVQAEPLPPALPPAPPACEPWRSYQEKGKDIAGRTIETIVAHGPDFIIYTTMGNVEPKGIPVLCYHIDGTDAARSHLSEANVLVSKIHSLAPKKSQHRGIIDKQLAGAYEMALRGRSGDCITILQDILDQLTGAQTAKGQLRYMVTNVVGCLIAWGGYCYQYNHGKSVILGPWLLAGTLGATGGVLSVAINLKTVNINVHQHWFLQCFAGWTRNVVAFLGGFACLLAIRAKIALVMAAGTDANIPPETAPLQMMEVFFCFLAGFSESLVPNILRDSESSATKNGAKVTTSPVKPIPGSDTKGPVPPGNSGDTPADAVDTSNA